MLIMRRKLISDLNLERLKALISGNVKWCGTTSLTNIVGLSDGASIPNTVSQSWIGSD